MFGSEDALVFNGVPTTNHLAYAVRLFFENDLRFLRQFA